MPNRVAQLRVVTANVQSFPDDALTLAQALEDLTRNAEIGDLVLLQEIATRYRPLVGRAFPAPRWTVFYGRPDNDSPIAFRRELFAKTDAAVTELHPPVAHRHRRRYTTRLRLRHRELGCELHVLNLHLVAGAFNDQPFPDKAERVREWEDAITAHRALVARLVGTGAAVVGGGDYNRQLLRCRPLGAEVAGHPVRYAVDPAAIDLIWFIDGAEARWELGDLTTFAGRGHPHAQRHSDHAARRASVTLRATSDPTPSTTEETTMPSATAHKPYDRTTYGDIRPKTVDWMTRAALEEAERRLGYRLTVVQGSYNPGGVRQSGGTHDGGGVVDLLAWDWRRKVRVLRAIGFAAWYRPPITGLWGAHIHAVLVGHGRLSTAAAAQVAAYRAGRDGLKGNRVDTFWRPSPIPVFSYPPVEQAPPDEAPTPPQQRPDPAEGPAGPAYPPKRALNGVDTSHHQGGRIDLKAARADGLQWWYVKATEGSTYVDPTYAKRVRQARRAGVPVGAYHFARPDRGDAVEEARFFLRTSDIRAGDMLPMLDLESSEGLSSAELTQWTGTWVRTVVRHLARRGLAGRPIIYTPFNLEKGFGCYLWVARYSDDFRPPTVPRPWQRAAIWQHSNGRFGPVRQVPGFGPVDVNAVHPDVPLAALRVHRAQRPAAPQPAAGAPQPPVPASVPSPASVPVPGPVPSPVVVPPPAAEPDRASMQDIRLALAAAARSIEAVVDRLPER